MRFDAPKLDKLSDLKKYIMIIETLEIDKLNKAISINTKLHQQIEAVENLKSIKAYYGELTHFLIDKQNRSRYDTLETEFAKELEDFLNFWQKTFRELEEVSKEEVDNIIQSNKELFHEANEILEQVVGFRPPPDKMFNDLMAVRSIAVKLKSDEAVKFLNFDYLKKRNQEINEKWIKDRRNFILKRMKVFEELLSKQVIVLKYRLNQELWRLQKKRQNQYDRLMVKYVKCKNIVGVINSNEMHNLKKLKTHFMTKNGIPQIALPEEPESDSILAELQNDGSQFNLAEKLKGLAVKGGNNLNMKSTDTYGMRKVGTDADPIMSMEERGKHNCHNIKNSLKVIESSKKNMHGAKNNPSKEMLNTSTDSQRTLPKNSGIKHSKLLKDDKPIKIPQGQKNGKNMNAPKRVKAT